MRHLSRHFRKIARQKLRFFRLVQSIIPRSASDFTAGILCGEKIWERETAAYTLLDIHINLTRV